MEAKPCPAHESDRRLWQICVALSTLPPPFIPPLPAPLSSPSTPPSSPSPPSPPPLPFSVPFIIHSDKLECIRTLSRGGVYWVIFPWRPRAEGNLEVGGHLYLFNSFYPDSKQCMYGHSLIIIPSLGMYQEIHPFSAMNIDSVDYERIATAHPPYQYLPFIVMFVFVNV